MTLMADPLFRTTLQAPPPTSTHTNAQTSMTRAWLCSMPWSECSRRMDQIGCNRTRGTKTYSLTQMQTTRTITCLHGKHMRRRLDAWSAILWLDAVDPDDINTELESAYHSSHKSWKWWSGIGKVLLFINQYHHKHLWFYRKWQHLFEILFYTNH